MHEFVVVITGGFGFVGGHITGILLRDEFPGFLASQVRILDLKVNFSHPRLKSLTPQQRNKLEIIEGSILDEGVVMQAFTGADLVIHAASLVDIGNYPESPDPLDQH